MSSEDDVKFKSTLVNELKLVNDGVPPTPPAGETTIYAKSDKKIYYLDDQGVERPVGGGSSAGGSGTWLFTGATSGDPGNFNLGFNNAVPASVTQISVYKTDFNNVSQTVLIASMSGGDQLYLKDSGTVGSKLYTLNSPANDAGTYFIFNVTFESEDQTNNYSAGSAISVDTMIQNPWDQQLNTTDTPTFAGLNLTGGDIQTQIDTKMDKVATTPLDMNGNVITNAGGLSCTGLVTTGSIQPAITGVSDIGLGGPMGSKYQNLFLSGAVQCETVDCTTVNCDGNVFTGDIIPKVTENRDVGSTSQKYRSAYFSNTVFTGSVDADAVFANSTLNINGTDVETTLTGLRTDTDANSSSIASLSSATTTGLALKMDKTATTDLNMQNFDINTVDRIALNRLVNISNNVLINLTTTDVSISTGGSESVVVDSTGLTVNDDAYVNGVVRTDTITALTTPLLWDGLAGPGYAYGGVPLEFANPGYPSFSGGKLQLTSFTQGFGESLVSYTDAPTISAINTATEWYMRFTAYYEDDVAPANVGWRLWAAPQVPFNYNQVYGYSFLFNPTGAITVLVSQNGVPGGSPAATFSPMTTGRDYDIQVRIKYIGTTSTELSFYIDGAHVGTLSDAYRTPSTITHVGIGARNASTLTDSASFFASNFEVGVGVPASPAVTIDSDTNINGSLVMTGGITFPKPFFELYEEANVAATTCTTQNTWYKVVQTPTLNPASQSFTSDAAGTLMCTAMMPRYYHTGVTISGFPSLNQDRNWEFCVYKNNAKQAGSVVAITTSASGSRYSTAIHSIMSLSQNDTLDLYVRCTSAASQSFTVTDINMFGMALPNAV